MYARQKLVLMAKAFNLQAIDMVYINYKGIKLTQLYCSRAYILLAATAIFFCLRFGWFETSMSTRNENGIYRKTSYTSKSNTDSTRKFSPYKVSN